MICPYCRKLYPNDDVFCPVDGNTLIEENEQETVVSRKVPFSAPSHSGQGYDDTVVFRPPVTPSHSQPASKGSTGNSILMGVLGGCVVLILVLIYFLVSGSPKPDSQRAESRNTPSPTPSPGPSSSPTPTATVENKNPSNTPNSGDQSIPAPEPPKVQTPRIPEGVERVFRGTSYVNGNLPLTLTLRRTGNTLSGSAQTPGDWDDLNGTIQPDGSFSMSGNNRLAGRVTGIWRGRIDENGGISGVWTSNSGKRVSYNAR